MSMTTPGGAGGGDAPPSSTRSGAAPNGSQNQAGDSIILEEEIDPNYEPTEDEVIEYAKWLGMDLAADKDLWWIAREGLKAPLPENWKPCKTTDTEEIYYFNFATGASTWDHPCDEYYRNLYEEEKKKRGSRHQTKEKKEQMERERSDVKKILGKDKKQRRKKRKSEKLANPLKTGAKLNDIRGKPLGGPLSRKPLGSIAKKKPLGGGGGDRGRDRDRDKDRKRDRDGDRDRRSRSKDDPDRRSRSRSNDRDRPTSSRSRAASRLSSALSDPEGGDRRSRDSSRDSRDRRSRSPLMHDKDREKDADENLSRRRNEMADELRDLESAHERKLRRMESEHAAELRSQERKHEDDVRDKRSKWDDELREAKSRSDRELREAREKAREEARAEVERERNREVDRAKDELDRLKDQSREEKERAERELRDELRTLQQDHEDKLADLKREQERAAERMERDSQDELDRRRRAIEAKHADSLEDLERDHRSVKERAERELREKMDAMRERERASLAELERKKDGLRDSQERELDTLREEHRQRMKNEEKELAENARREKERAQERARREVEKVQQQELEELKEKGRTTLRQSREAHVEEMQKLTSRQNEEEHRMRKRLEEIRKRASDAVEMAEAEAREGGSSSESKSGADKTSDDVAAHVVKLEKDVRGLEDRLRSAEDTNDGLRRSLEQAESRCERAEENMRETERDRKKAVAEAKDARKLEEENMRGRKIAEEKLDELKRDLARERRRAQDAEEEVKKTALALAEHSSEASMATATAKRHEEALSRLRRTHQSELRELRERLEARNEDDVRTARNEERARASRASGDALSEKHSAEVDKLRGNIDEERKRKEKLADDVRAARKEAEEASEVQAALQRQVDSLQASLDAQGKGAMGKVEQMKVFRKQVSDLEEHLRKAKADLEAAEEGKTRAERRCDDETRRLQRELADAGREKEDLETRSKESEIAVTELRSTLREVREAARAKASEQSNTINGLKTRLELELASTPSAAAATVTTSQDVTRAVQQRESELREEYDNKLEAALEAQRKDLDLQAAPSSPNPFSISPAALTEEKKRYEALREELDRAKGKSQRLEADLAAATEAFTSTQRSGDTKGRSDKLITTVTELRRENNDLVDRAEESEARAKIAEGETSTAIEKVKILRASLLELEVENRRTKAQCEEAIATLASERRRHTEDASLSERSQANLKREAEDLARQLEENKLLASALTAEVDAAKKSARDMAEAATASGGDTTGKIELLQQVAQHRVRIASLESREEALMRQLDESSVALSTAKSEARQMRMDIARQKKTIQKYEATFDKRKHDDPSGGIAPQKSSETKASYSATSQPREAALAWQQKARNERELLGRAKKYVESQKKEVKRRQRRIERDRKDWREDMRQYQRATENLDPSSRSRSRRQMMREIKKSLEHDASELNEAVAHLRSMEQWLKNRERKVVKLEAAAFNFNNPGVNLDESSFNAGADGLDMSDLAGWEHSSGSTGDEGELERLSDELDDDFSSLNMSMSGTEDSGRGNLQNTGGADPVMWARIMAGMMHQQHQARRQPRRRSRRQNQTRHNRGAGRRGSSFWNDENNMYAAAAVAAAAAMEQHQRQSYTSLRNTWFQKVPQHYAGENVDINMEREWMGRGRPPADRVNSANGPAIPNPESNHRRDVFQRQIQSWAGRHQTARDAMSKHAKWLRKFGQEIQGARVNEANHVGPGGKSKPAKAKSVTRGLAANVLSPNVKRAAGLDSKEEVSVEDL